MARPRRRPAAATPTPDLVLDAAERLVQTLGYNGFSYADVSAEVGITKASLHYHFPNKADLGRALVDRYTVAFTRALSSIAEREPRARARLEGYARLYQDVLERGRMCLCGMLAAEHATLPPAMQRAIRGFFDANEAWLAAVLDEGRRAGEASFSGTARDAARLCASTLEGAMLLARSYGEPARLTIAVRRMLDDLQPSGRAASGAGRRRKGG